MHCFSGGYSGKIQLQLSTDNLGEQNVLEGTFFRLSRSLKFEILPTKVPLSGYNGFTIKPILGYSEVGTCVAYGAYFLHDFFLKMFLVYTLSVDKVSMSYLFSLSEYQTKSVIKFLYRQLRLSDHQH